MGWRDAQWFRAIHCTCRGLNSHLVATTAYSTGCRVSRARRKPMFTCNTLAQIHMMKSKINLKKKNDMNYAVSKTVSILPAHEIEPKIN